jgi:tetraacyldisaccharide 4'-kinase
MREYIYSLMTDRRKGVPAALAKGILHIASFFYGIAVIFIRRMRTAHARRLPCKVISVGNITMGGTGKTPAACSFAKALKRNGRRPSVLIRGYGDDEWKMLQTLLGDIPLIVGKDRVKTASEACGNYNSDCVVLDDGFQHWRLKRDLDIVLIDSTDPFGNRHLIPRGILREGVKSLRRSDLIILTKTDMASGKTGGIRDELTGLAPGVPVLESVHRPVDLYDAASGEARGPDFINGRDIYALSSIVNTAYFEYILARLGARIRGRRHYPDHYNYTKEDMDSVAEECRSAGAGIIVTTEKDMPKLPSRRLPSVEILIMRIEFEVKDAEGVLEQRLRSLFRG